MKKERELSPVKQALLERWKRGEADAPPEGIVPRPAASPQPLSFSQQRQLFLELLEPGSAVNNLSVCFELEGPLDVGALRESVRRMFDRHETLRTQFDMRHGLPSPQVSRTARVSLPLVELGHLPEGERLDEALRRARAEALEPIDLEKAPLLRLALFQLGVERHILSVVVHHTIGDGASLDVLLRDLLAFYGTITSGHPLDLPELTIQYSDYAFWQRDSARRQDLHGNLAYWVERLKGAPPFLDLPVDHSRGMRQTFAGATHHFRIDRELASALRALSRASDVSLFMTLLAAFDVLLYRYTGCTDISVGTPVAGRHLPEVKHLIGSFINTLVLRTDLAGDQTFAELVRQIRATALGAYAHQSLPFERLVAELKPERDLSRTPLFQVMLNLQSSRLSEVAIPGLRVRPLPLESETSQFDLTLMFIEREEELAGSIEYNTDLFEPATIERIADSYARLLQGAVERPESRLSRLPVLAESDERALLEDRNRSDQAYPCDTLLHELIESQAERSAERTAVVDERERLSYRELVGRSRALATRLRRAGVGPGVRVGVCIDRSADLVTTLLGVLKAGGAYVPLSPSDPSRRIRYVLSDADVQVLITEAHLEVPERDGCEVLYLDADLDRAETPSDSTTRGDGEALPGISAAAGSEAGATAEEAAYVIYTSGSTGRPKGVAVSHRALVNFLWSMRESPGLEASDVLLAVTPLSFDISALELYLPLLVGSTVVVASDETRRDPVRLGQALTQYGITVMQATPATWRTLVDSGWTGEPRLKCLSGGEALSPDLAAQLLARVGSLWNLYGPTETTVWSAVGHVRDPADVTTLGDPVANTQLYVLDNDGNVPPPGVKAELCIGGDGLALGYLNDPELTRCRFLPDPFRGAGHRLYWTGDSASYRPDGRITLHGRLDSQVKIQGHRVELGEVETALGEHPVVHQVAVTARGSDPGRRRLAAYFVPDRTPPPGADDLRVFLRDLLPAYMIPVTFTPMDAFPLSSTGKIDRGALPAPERERPRLGTSFVAPRNELEERLAVVYSRVLGLDRIGIHDNLFDIGGGSLQILELILALQETDLTLAPEHFFLHQTVAEMAESIAEGLGPGSERRQ